MELIVALDEAINALSRGGNGKTEILAVFQALKEDIDPAPTSYGKAFHDAWDRVKTTSSDIREEIEKISAMPCEVPSQLAIDDVKDVQ